MARPLKPLIKSGGYYPSRRWTPLIYPGGYTTANGGGQPEPDPEIKTVSGSIVHILDALARPAISLVCQINPIQDLHGYDSPWPAGGGKNKFNVDVMPLTPSEQPPGDVSRSANGTINVYASSTSAGTASYTDHFLKLSDYAPNLIVGETYYLSFTSTGSQKRIYLSVSANIWAENTSRVITQDDLDSVVYFYASGADTKATITEFQIELGSTATAWTPYSNICPISGHTDADVTRTGVNVWDEEWENGTFNTTTGVNINIVQTNQQIRTKNLIPLVGGQSYYFKYPNAGIGAGPWTMFYDENENIVSNFTPSTGYVPKSGNSFLLNSRVVTVPDNIRYCKFYCTVDYGASYNNDISINYPSTDTSYHAYTGTTYPIPLGQTVYGGTLDVTAGTLTVDRAINVIDGTQTIEWNGALAHGGAQVVYTPVPAKALAESIATQNSGLASDKFSTSHAYIISPFELTGRATNANIYLNLPETVTTRAQAITWFTNNPTQVVYKLATPFEISLTPTQIDMLLGTNNLWADAGDSTLTYYADGNASTSEALGILLGGTYNNPGGADDASDDEALGILLGGS